MKQFTQILLLAIAFIFTSCFEKEAKDKIEEVTMYVSHETGIYYGMLSSPVEGMLIKEEGWNTKTFSVNRLTGYMWILRRWPSTRRKAASQLNFWKKENTTTILLN